MWKTVNSQTKMDKVKICKLILFCLVTFEVAIYSNEQNLNIEFDHYTTKDGLSNGYVNSIVQDSRGFIWIGTLRGLDRFDGISFKEYLFDPKDTNSIPDNLITALIEDSSGNIWIATNHNLCMYNKNKDNFSRKLFKVNNKVYDNLSLTSIFIDSQGFLWIGSRSGIFKIKLYKNSHIYNNVIDVDRYVLDEPDLNQYHRSISFSFVEDEKRNIWLSSCSNKLFYFDYLKNNFISYAINLPEFKKFNDEQKYMIKDRDGDFIISIEGNGLLVWQRKKNKFILYKPNGTETGPSDDILFALAEDNNGMIWAGGRDKGGINIFNKKTGKFMLYSHDESNPHSLNTDKVSCIYYDKTGSMWVGVNIGLDKYNPNKLKFKRYYNTKKSDGLSFDNILCFEESKSNDIWIGTDGGGLYKLNRSTNKFTHYFNEPLNSYSLSSNAIISLCEDNEGTLWLGTFNGGLGEMKNNSFFAWYPNPSNPYSIASRHIWYVLEDSKKNLWVGTLNSGLELFDRNNNRFYHYVTNDSDSTSLTNNGILQLFEDSKNNLYITTYMGVSIIDLNAYDFKKMPPKIKFKNLLHKNYGNSLSSNWVYCVAEDKENNLWFGTMVTGLDKYDRKSGLFTNYSIKDGLPGNLINSVLVDNQNNLWLATNKGLAKFNPKTLKVEIFDNQDGLQNMNFNGHALKTKNGEMFFGGPNGFNSFYPSRIKYNKKVPPVYITGLRIFNKTVKTGDRINNRVILTNDISIIKELKLTYKENFITFEFIALDLDIPNKNQFAYKMEGFDKDWIKCGAKREANYTNLVPGKYIFNVKASNNDGVWNNNGTSLIVIILPPWWKTLWFKSIILLLTMALIFITYYLRIAFYRRRQKELTTMVKQRTYELLKTNRLLTERQLRIEEQSEELKTINEQLLARQAKIEEQSEEISSNSANLKDINNQLIEKQKLVLKQSEQLKETNQQLSILNATKDRFFSIIAHDLRNPFNVVSGFSEILLKNIDNLPAEKVHKFLDMIHASSLNGNYLLENLLQWSRSQSGRISFEPSELNLFAIVEENIRLVKADAERKHIQFQQLIDPDVTVFGDENMIKAILRNLLSNAIKFSYEKGTIIIKSSTNNQFVEITVADNGVGISKETIDKLFRVDSTITTKGTAKEPGTGLGLIICKEFIEKHNGKIWVESVVGKGSEFKFALPLN